MVAKPLRREESEKRVLAKSFLRRVRERERRFGHDNIYRIKNPGMFVISNRIAAIKRVEAEEFQTNAERENDSLPN